MNIIDDDENFPYGDQDVSDDEDVEDGAANDDSDDDPNNYNRYPNYDEYNERRRGYRAQRKELRRRSASPVLNPARLRYPEINTGKRNDNCGSVTIAALASDGKAGSELDQKYRLVFIKLIVIVKPPKKSTKLLPPNTPRTQTLMVWSTWTGTSSTHKLWARAEDGGLKKLQILALGRPQIWKGMVSRRIRCSVSNTDKARGSRTIA